LPGDSYFLPNKTVDAICFSPDWYLSPEISLVLRAADFKPNRLEGKAVRGYEWRTFLEIKFPLLICLDKWSGILELTILS
jgi:hypothetical protein